MKKITRRQFGAVSAAPLIGIMSRRFSPARWAGRQYHNQPADSHQHRFLVELWNAVKAETNGELDVTVYPQNNNIDGSDPAALDLLQHGGLEFFTVMGGILGLAVPVAEIQGVPFAFASHQQVHAANDGKLGEFIGRECAAKGIHRFQYGLLENGFRQISMTSKPIRTAADLEGTTIRVPESQIIREAFQTFGAQTVTVNINQLYDALKAHRVDGQENPLVVTEFNKLYEVTRYLSITNHIWSGFNLLANLKFWQALPDTIQTVVDRNVKKYVAEQRAYTDGLNNKLADTLAGRGMIVNVADAATFRAKLAGGAYRRWRDQLGASAWALLEETAGKLI